MSEWHDFFIAEVGASSALCGLLFVALSINIERILKYPWLPSRAAQTLIVLLSVLVQASLGLLPAQSVRMLGGELLVTGAAAWALCFWLSRTAPKPAADIAAKTAVNELLLHACTLPCVVAGLLLIAFSSVTGLFFFSASVIFSFVFGVLTSWVLLVEILR